MTTVTEKQLKTINYCLTDFRDRKTYEITSFLPALLDDLLIPTSIGMEMSAVYIDCDVDQDGLPDNLKNTKGITFEFMDDFVTLPTEEGINYISDWCEKNVLENREEVLQKARKLKEKYLKK
ncbi:hypothetical protein ABH908_004094 [Pseudomonas frederiksbergensis]|jgi:hypothetical protein|uniref:hypothetical protein n=1 Tax=Pseudomonas TaxID=286 RepID=UPI000DACCCCA|nr:MULTISPECIES: hypothetical protein [unclassified Pseudomonas]MBD9616388.1 hypothetical protein [Pseudomonas sp. PDM07]PZW61629.1 hypothetical protein F475_02462 [Pseudomonas sp. URMO17WK12:I6]QDV96331.1 hypothetical protein FFH90_019365 [Pseudomonas sp. ATCC 43928]UVM36726.1 hypothetical protein LOY28_18620 [Pseudomonas sp. B21-017]CAH0288060.1 hypothetical protein SRABI130_04268 [Pseudomonas sp. Bi130]